MATERSQDRRGVGPPRFVSGLALGTATVLLGLVALFAAPVAAQSDELGVATVRSRSGEPIDGGGSATEFTIDLPDGAECPGDSANDDYRVGSYMLPATVSPFDVEWSGEGPVPYSYGDYETFRQPLYDDLTSGFSSKALANNDGPGQPGQILDFPAFTFNVYEPGTLPPGRYNIGIVCNYYADVTTAWNAVIEVAADPTDVPAQVQWTLVEGAAPAASGGNTLLVAVLVVGVAVLALAVWLVVRPRRTSRSTPPENPTREIR